MKMAAARPQSVFTADVYLSDNSNGAPTLAFARDVCVTGWTTWEMGLWRKTVMLFMMIVWLQLRNGTMIREIYQLVNFFSYFSSDCHSERSILSSHQPLIPYLQRQLLHAFVQLFWMAVANYNFGLQAFCSTLSWMGEMTCGLGYWDSGGKM